MLSPFIEKSMAAGINPIIFLCAAGNNPIMLLSAALIKHVDFISCNNVLLHCAECSGGDNFSPHL